MWTISIWATLTASCQHAAGLTPLQGAIPQDRTSSTPLRLGHKHILMLCGHEFQYCSCFFSADLQTFCPTAEV